MPEDPTLSQQQAQALMALLNLHGPAHITQVREYNHTYRIACQSQAFYLKLHTKDWYPPDEGATGFSVYHEISAWSILARHHLATPEVVLSGQNRENPIGRSFLLTREVPGQLLADILTQVSPDEIPQILQTVGLYLKGMHAIQFPYAGYILGVGPTDPPAEHSWQHFTWTLRARQHYTQQWIQAHQAELSSSLLNQLADVVQHIPDHLALAYTQPRFTQGDCCTDQIMMAHKDGSWQVMAFLDMEVASAGDCVSDVVSLCIALAQVLPNSSFWWQALFAGYSEVPAFEAFRLRLLTGWYPYEAHIWPGVGEHAFHHLLQASDWQTLFSHVHLMPVFPAPAAHQSAPQDAS